MADDGNDLATRTRHWAMRLTRQPSVNGTDDEAALGAWLSDALGNSKTFGDQVAVWTIPVAPGDRRECVALFVPGSGRRTVLLTGHFDTVAIDDYGDLRGVATDPDLLLQALTDRLSARAETPAERRAKADFASGEYLPGRGLLDMKAGLAAGLAVMERFAAGKAASGNLLFIAVPDEENASAGARRAAPALVEIAADRGLDLVAAINLDAIADDGDGSAGRAIALGTVGKLLPTAFVAGVPAHGGFPFNGVNAAALIAAIALRLEWAPELTDDGAAQPGTPPSLLSLRDGKSGYDVTTPGTAFATWNVLTHRRSPEEVLRIFEQLCVEAATSCLEELAHRAAASTLPEGRTAAAGKIHHYRYEEIREAAERKSPGFAKKLRELGVKLGSSGLPLPEQCRRVTERVWRESRLAGPAIVTGFGSIPYLSTQLSSSSEARRLDATVRAAAAASQDRYGTSVTCTEYFAGISDMSFFGEADEASLDIVERNTPVWKDSVAWPEGRASGMIPVVNIGPWGRDYHTPLERLHTGYGFNVLPRLLFDVVVAVLDIEASTS